LAARIAVQEFVGADEGYDVVWTVNALMAMDVVAGGIDWRGKRSLVTVDSHKCVNGLARRARGEGAIIDYVELDPRTCISTRYNSWCVIPLLPSAYVMSS
jgi:selenocysteine lyase/cysteine desulfurase